MSLFGCGHDAKAADDDQRSQQPTCRRRPVAVALHLSAACRRHQSVAMATNRYAGCQVSLRCANQYQ